MLFRGYEHLLKHREQLTPTERLKSVNDESMALAYAEALNRLFSLFEEKNDAAAPPAKVSSR